MTPRTPFLLSSSLFVLTTVGVAACGAPEDGDGMTGAPAPMRAGEPVETPAVGVSCPSRGALQTPVSLTATSDGDVLAHAVTDAVLGACVLGDLGEHFPSSDPLFAGAHSLSLLREAAAMATAAGFAIAHVDTTVIAERIRVAPHRQQMRENLADALGVTPDVISVKATTTDGLGFTGTSQGVAAVAVVTVIPTP
jgi:2-C-methyl-D-erythritol 2,4-cyclodiphosphate synthase